MSQLLELFLSFSRIGAFTFGGGHAMLPLIQRDIVEKHKWLSEEDFLDVFAVSQSLPGVFAVNISIFIGYRKAGFIGGLVAALGTILPSFIIILLLALFFESVRDNQVVSAIMSGIRPAVVAMIVIPVITIWKAMNLKRYMLVIPVVVAIVVWYFNFSPVWVILLSGFIGIVYMVIRTNIEARGMGNKSKKEGK